MRCCRAIDYCHTLKDAIEGVAAMMPCYHIRHADATPFAAMPLHTPCHADIVAA